MKMHTSSWMHTGAIISALTCAEAAFAYPMEVKSALNGMDLKVNSMGDGLVAAVEIRNDDRRTAKCQVVFVNGPELPDRNTTTIAPGRSQTVRFVAKRSVIKLDVTVSCAPVESAK